MEVKTSFQSLMKQGSQKKGLPCERNELHQMDGKQQAYNTNRGITKKDTQ